MFLSSLIKKILVVSCFSSVAFCFATKYPLVVEGKGGLVAKCKSKQNICANKTMYHVYIRHGNNTLASQFYATPVRSMEFKDDGYLYVQFGNGRCDPILLR
jgi:hypothetical protein